MAAKYKSYRLVFVSINDLKSLIELSIMFAPYRSYLVFALSLFICVRIEKLDYNQKAPSDELYFSKPTETIFNSSKLTLYWHIPNFKRKVSRFQQNDFIGLQSKILENLLGNSLGGVERGRHGKWDYHFWILFSMMNMSC